MNDADLFRGLYLKGGIEEIDRHNKFVKENPETYRKAREIMDYLLGDNFEDEDEGEEDEHNEH
ncbi:hypothetical protein HNO53_13030 [Billgrantia antri]|uniref:Uncharacterized protein n=1 Tax=Halomonas sulfidivorans TaxID=2733488 RepID=A0ABX7WGL8_9GAMM|nr:hypothetical protein [Halomonas sulfidivorans]QTP59559.1 hypothetical protein HNO53_13030 [Halomonas sulfidivorans]